MRSLMFVPAHNERLLKSADRSDADVLLLDIEDSVQPLENKQIARDKIIECINKNWFQKHLLFPRINDRESGELLKDLMQLSINGIDGFMYPKAHTGKDIYFIDKLLETIEYEKGFEIGTFKLIPDSIFTPRAMIAMAARANNVVPVDTVHINVYDLEDLERNLEIAKNLGFEGMLILNPKELPLAHQYFSPTEKEVTDAQEMLKLAEEAKKEGKGVAIKNNKFIGPPMILSAKKIIERHKQILNKKL